MNHTTFYRTPHTLRADFPINDQTCRRPTIDLPNGYPYRWHVHHFELHLRSEHAIDGRRFDGEIQQYHLGQKDQKREMAAVSILLDASGYRDDDRLQTYIDKWEAAAQDEITDCTRRNLRIHPDEPSNDPTTWTRKGEYNVTDGLAESALLDEEHIDSVRSLEEVDKDGYPLSSYAPRRKMFPYDIWPTIYHYRYRGSITSPPCSEIVSWRVMDEPLVISRKQYKALARLLKTYVNPQTCEVETKASPTGENMRPLQAFNRDQQQVVHCTKQDFGYNLYPPNQQ
jgi:carbonic anhydrase